MKSSINKKVAVFGGTGMLGKPVVNALLASGFEVNALVRAESRGKRLLPAEVNLIVGDLDRIIDVENTIDGADYLYINLSVVATDLQEQSFIAERDGIDHILEACKKYNVKHVSYISSLVQRVQGTKGINWWIFDIKQRAIAKIKESGIPYTIFYPSGFMENYSDGAIVKGQSIQVVGKSNFKNYLIAGPDYGKMVAMDFIKNEDSGSREYDIQGLEGLTTEEAAKIWQDNYTGKELKISRVPEGLLTFLAFFSGEIKYAKNILQALNRYEETYNAEKAWNDLHKPEITLKDWAKLQTAS